MTRVFNIVGQCNPDYHYMVNIDSRLSEIKELVDMGFYFVINRARQYGKTTTLKALVNFLRKDYAAIFLSFQRMGSEKFRDEHAFSIAFAETFLKAVKRNHIDEFQPDALLKLQTEVDQPDSTLELLELFDCLSYICETALKPIVLIIDEVDNASNNQVFLDFLAQLREFYIERFEISVFQSVILAGVYDIKNLKQKIRPEDKHRYNSPWNIAEEFNVDMSFSTEDIAGMLSDYVHDHSVEIDIDRVAGMIYDYTSGYPFLVSYICKLLDEKIPYEERFRSNAWTESGVSEAVKIILKQPATLFESMCKQLDIYPQLREMLFDILFKGKSYPYNPDNDSMSMGTMFGFIKEKDGMIAISNRIFETRLYNLFMSEEVVNSPMYNEGLLYKTQFINDRMLNMKRILEKFVQHFSEVYSENNEKFIEDNGRRIFLLYLKPIINGVGNYYVEARTRDMRRTDVIVDYLGKQYVIEMKIWHGDEYNCRGEQQLVGYLNEYHQTTGYLLSFNFNKNKKIGVKEIQYEDKVIIEAVV